MAAAVTALNHYTKTMTQFKVKRKNIENNLELLELDMRVGLWDTYLRSGFDLADQHMLFEVNGTRLIYSSSPETAKLHSQGEDYC